MIVSALALWAFVKLVDSPTLATTYGNELRLWDDSGKVVRTIKSGAKVLSWSPSRRYLLLEESTSKLSTLDLQKPDSSPVTLSEKATHAIWGAQDVVLFERSGGGIFSASPESKPELVTPQGHFPAASPDGREIAFTTNGAQGGVWIAKINGEGARRVLKGKTAGQVYWSYDGKWLVAVVDDHARIVRNSGRLPKDLGAVSDPRVSWSGGSALLLAQRTGAWSSWSFVTGKWSAVGLDAVALPQWIGPRKLLGLKGARAQEFKLDGSGEGLSLGDGDVKSVSRAVGSYMGVAFPDPFAKAARPKRGQTALRGKIESSDPIDGKVSIRVETETDSRGRETILGESRLAVLSVKDTRLMRKFSLAPDAEVRLLAEGGTAIGAVIPDAGDVVPAEPVPVPAATNARGRVIRGTTNRAPHPARSSEYDGITREVVVVPMIYPIPGKHKFTDTFLAPRGNGSRRHHGNDLMAPKMTPLLAVFDGVVWFARTNRAGSHNILNLQSDDGWAASYMHINNDNPGTDDGEGSSRYAYPADLQPGDRVRAGQVIAWCGDSGNAEDVGPHLHIEIYDEDNGVIINPAHSFRAAQKIKEPLYPDPDATLIASPGEVRYDGVISGVDLDKRAVAIELTGTGNPNQPPKRNLKPRLAYLQIPAGVMMRYRTQPDTKYPLEALRSGFQISAIGRLEGGKLVLREASIALGGSE